MGHIRQSALREDGANLAAFLLRIRDTRLDTIPGSSRLSDKLHRSLLILCLTRSEIPSCCNGANEIQILTFGPHQASDGTLRVMALVSLLLQPEDELPMVIILDEPELGLHPYAISVLAGLIQSISNHTQVILATQSMTLIDHFEPNEIIVVDRPDRDSVFSHLDESRLQGWLNDYSIAELWEKNVIGGRPSR